MEQWIHFMWNPCLITLFIGIGCYCSLKTGFLQGCMAIWWRATIGQMGKGSADGVWSQVASLCLALATTIGTGSIAGVATAIWYGGPGAIFWMWVSAFFGMMLSACEKVLTIVYRVPNHHGGYSGGPMFYMERGVGSTLLAKWFSVGCVGAALVGGTLVQATSITQGVSYFMPVSPLWTGAVLVVLVAFTLPKGMAYITKLSQVLVPVMATCYIGGGLYCLVQDIPAVCMALRAIVEQAFSLQAVTGGVGGYTMLVGIRYGVARGIFSNEAGLGAGAIAHGNAQVDHPARQGCWGMVEVFFATFVVCTLTALVILTSGIYRMEVAEFILIQGEEPLVSVGVPLTQMAFSIHLGEVGHVIVVGSLVLFAFTSILGWSCYGTQALTYLSNQSWVHTLYRMLTLGCLMGGCLLSSETVWLWVDFFLAVMAIPNLIALWVLAPQATTLLNQWTQAQRK